SLTAAMYGGPEIETALIDAVRRDQRRRGDRRLARVVGWVRARPRGLLLLAGALVVAGTAAAAVTLAGQRSAPLSGIVPPGQEPRTAVASGTRYDIQIAPSIQAGQIGWCVAIRTFSSSGRVQDGGTGTCDGGAPTIGNPLFGVPGGELGLQGLDYVFASSRVAAVRIAGGPTVLTRPDPRLPYQYRAAVFEVHQPSGSSPDGLAIPGGATQPMTALDSSGRPIADSSGPPVEPTHTWLYPAAASRGTCSLAARAGSGLIAGSGTVVTSIVPAPAIAGHAFLPCVDIDLYTRPSPAEIRALERTSAHKPGGPYRRLAALERYDGSLEAAVLLDAAHPGARPASLPDMHPLAAHPGVFDRPTADLPLIENTGAGMTATRVGPAWLVVVGGSGTSQRVEALRDLIVGTIHADTAAPSPTGPVGGLCSITYQPLAGMRPVSENAITSPRDTRNAFTNAGQRIVNAAYTRLREDQAHLADPAQLAVDLARLELDQQALQRRIMVDQLFPPTCAVASFYYQRRWPMTATIALATRTCPGPRLPVSCDRLRPAWRNTLSRVLKAVPGQPQEFIVPP
ncbi:MAG: hypothetical protein ACRDLV_11380, partial [Solirubrobacteraceae bacterium]